MARKTGTVVFEAEPFVPPPEQVATTLMVLLRQPDLWFRGGTDRVPKTAVLV